MDTYRKLEDLIVYQKLCQLHIDISAITHKWPDAQEAAEPYLASPPGFPDSSLNPEP